MRRVGLLRLVLVCTACATAACGSSTVAASNPVKTELSYFPATSPLVLSIATDPHGPAISNLGSLMGSYPAAAFGEAYAKTRLQALGINYDTDLHPLFGNPIMLGLADAAGASSKSLVIAWVTKDASALASLVRKFHLQMTRAYDGATLYRSSSVAVAVAGATVLLGTSQQALMSALDRHARNAGVTEAEMRTATSGLPQDAFIQAFGSLSGVLSTPSVARARSVPWVAALRGYALTLSASSAGLSVNFKLDTGGASLTAGDLPIASGTGPPSLAGSAPIEVGLRDPGVLVAFLLEAERTSSPATFATFLKRQATLRRKTGVDLSSLLGQLTGDLVINSDAHNVMGRVAVGNAAAATAILAKLATAPGGVLAGTAITREPGGFYAIKDKRRVINVGIASNELVAGEASPSELRAFAAAPSTPAPAGSRGSVAFKIAVPALIQLAVKNAPAQLQTLLASLGDITGWIAATPSEMTGQASLALK